MSRNYSYFWKVRLLQFLNEPFPDSDDLLDNIRGAILSGFLVILVIYLVRPMNISDTANGLFRACLPYGVITTLVVFCYQLLSIYVFKWNREAQTWTFWKWISHDIVMIICIAIVNILYNHFYYKMGLDLYLVVKFIGYTFLIGLVPLVLVGGLKVFRNKKRYTHLASNLSNAIAKGANDNKVESTKKSRNQVDESDISVEVKAGNKSIMLNPRQILLASSMQNYVQLHLIVEGEVTITTLRKTLASLEMDLKSYDIQRCHRSYLVNKSRVTSVKGNAQGLKLYFDETDVMVPVSRKYVSIFR